MPHSTPSAESTASSGPESTVIFRLGMRAHKAWTNSGPFCASRTAEVASTSNGLAPMARTMAL
jgi:hypothetical protein